jgi:hypothetical protein
MALDLQEFKKTLIYELEGPVTEVQRDVPRLRLVDKHFEKLAFRALMVALVLSLATIIGGVATFMAFDSRAEHPEIPGAVTVALLIATIVSWIVRSRRKRLDTEDRRYELVGQLLRLLKTDMAADATVNVRLDLGPADARAKFDREGEAGPWSVKYYVDPWLQLRGRLLDGTRFLVTMIEKTQHRSRWKRSASGKMKRKTKTKSGSEASLLLKIKPSRHPALQKLGSDANGALQLPPEVQPKDLQVTAEGIVLKTRLDPEWVVPGPNEREEDMTGPSGPHAVAMMFLSLYQILNLSKAIGKKAAAGGQA